MLNRTGIRINRYIAVAVTVILASSMSYYAAAQDETDALRYSTITSQGTARSIGLAGAMGSIGGDFSSLSVNPAGIGVYRSSEFLFSPSIKFNGVSGTYSGTTMTDNATRFTFNNVGAVFTRAEKGKRYQNSNWKTVSFAVGINRVADFNRNYTYGGYNGDSVSGSSASEVYVEYANNYPGSIDEPGTPAYLGWQTYLIDTFGGGYASVVPWHTGLNQKRRVQERGGISELLFSFGGNYQEKLLLGATIGLPSIRYLRQTTYTETDATNNPNNNFSSFTFEDDLQTTGIGINLKLGFIVKPTDNFRIGAAIHTPTAYGLTEIYNASLSANTENFAGINGVNQPENAYSYTMVTPWRGVVSAAALFGKYGFITADYEYVNYASARYSFDEGNEDYEQYINNVIKNTYRSASNIRIGVEGRFDAIMGRVGFGYYGSPYEKSYSNAARMDFSAGLGFRGESGLFADIGFVHTRQDVQEQPYLLTYPGVTVPTATLKNGLNNVVLTLGFKF